MKVLSVPQPYASLITAGICDFMNDIWRPRDEPSRILIYANKKRISARSFIENEPTEWFQDVLNHMRFGNIPDFKDMPCGAIIGFVTIDTIEKSSDDNGISYDWHFKDAYLFDEPIVGVKGKPRLWDYDINEDDLPPAHKVKINEAHFRDSNIYIPLCKSLWDNLKPNGFISLEFTDTLQEQYNKELKPLWPYYVSYQVHFTFNGLKRSFFVKIDDDNDLNIDVPEWYIGPGINEESIPRLYYSDYYNDIDRDIITFRFGKEIK